MACWARPCGNYLGHSAFPGGHFYINDQAPAVAADFAGHLTRLLG